MKSQFATSFSGFRFATLNFIPQLHWGPMKNVLCTNAIGEMLREGNIRCEGDFIARVRRTRVFDFLTTKFQQRSSNNAVLTTQFQLRSRNKIFDFPIAKLLRLSTYCQFQFLIPYWAEMNNLIRKIKKSIGPNSNIHILCFRSNSYSRLFYLKG